MRYTQGESDWIDAERRCADQAERIVAGRQAAVTRSQQALSILRGHIDAIASHMAADLPTAGARQAMVESAVRLSELLAIAEAFQHVKDGRT